MKSSLVALAAEESEAAHTLPMPAEAYGIIAFVALMTLLLIAMAFRSVYTRR